MLAVAADGLPFPATCRSAAAGVRSLCQPPVDVTISSFILPLLIGASSFPGANLYYGWPPPRMRAVSRRWRDRARRRCASARRHNRSRGGSGPARLCYDHLGGRIGGGSCTNAPAELGRAALASPLEVPVRDVGERAERAPDGLWAREGAVWLPPRGRPAACCWAASWLDWSYSPAIPLAVVALLCGGLALW